MIKTKRPKGSSVQETTSSVKQAVTLRDVTAGGRLRKPYQSVVWDIAQGVASSRNEAISGHRLTSRQMTRLAFLDDEVSDSRGDFGPACGMFWDGLLVKASLLGELGFNAAQRLHQVVPTHSQLQKLERDGKSSVDKSI